MSSNRLTFGDPLFSEIGAMLKRDYSFANFFDEFNQSIRTYPYVNRYYSGDKYIIELFVPGFDKDDLSVKIEKEMIKISGKVKEDEKEKNKQYISKQIKYECFEKTLVIPPDFDYSNVVAEYKNGTLVITMPKFVKKETQAHIIEIK